MITTVHLTDEIAAIVQRKVDQGLFSDAESAVAEAVRRLADDDEYESELRSKLQVGFDQIEQGEVLEWTPQLNDRLFEEAMELYRSGAKPLPDV